MFYLQIKSQPKNNNQDEQPIKIENEKQLQQIFENNQYCTNTRDICPFCGENCPETDHIDKKHKDESGWFKCFLCSHTCQLRHDMIDHIDTHELYRFLCPYLDCLKKERRLVLYMRHMRECHNIFKCGIEDCFYSCHSLVDVQNHIKETGVFKCPKCDYISHARKNIETHMYLHFDKYDTSV